MVYKEHENSSISNTSGADQAIGGSPQSTSFHKSMDTSINNDESTEADSMTNKRKMNDSSENGDKDKKIHKKKLRRLMESPGFELVWENPKRSKALSVSSIRDMIVHIFNDSEHLSWIKFRKSSEIKKVVVCLVSGLTRQDFLDGEKQDLGKHYVPLKDIPKSNDLSFFHENFEHLIKTIAPGDKESLFSEIYALTSVPLSKKEKRVLAAEECNNKITILGLVLKKDELLQFDYPIHSKFLDKSNDESYNDPCADYVETVNFDHDGSRIFSLDCEFCKSATQKVLTRASLVNFEGEVVFDTFVKPDEEIIDYVTKFSGITPELLEGVSTTLEDVRNKLLSIISSSDVLIGHSLESDLNILKIKHPTIVDTALCYDHTRGPPSKPSLKWLSKKYLQRDIQQGETTGSGHSSVEDAKAALDLIKLKIQEGMSFGKNVNEIPLFQKINKPEENTVSSLMVDYFHVPGKFGKEDKNHHTRIQSDDDAETVKIVKENVGNYDLIISRLRSLQLDKKSQKDTLNGDTTTDSSPEASSYKTLNSNLTEIYNSLPENTAFIVSTCSERTQEIDEMIKVKRNFQKLEREGGNLASLPKEQCWDFNKSVQLQQQIGSARETMCFLSIKQNR
ncbi:Piso0_005090 [Millerozyma farinosa CBS 7064]|uniref:Piso0_005090 protein n=1 Tax=Pichia sorbitophila (strain ATCC MYA-4447 / BCRC 22081 / CBS 7064 / NBRC 10061 / NRRL Y-12695) TaxID=559304 RepID=G8Y475_PICSO|nr:Piso0_005090 [Millerozyma farinosa CBS 7064]